MNGLIIVNKPINKTSRDVVNELTTFFRTKKIGHSGTLDPLATGVLVVCIGKYTKLVNYLTSEEKEYIATIKLGISTDTLDITGKIEKTCEIKKYEESEINDIFQSFKRKYMQTVPLYSAVHFNGKRLYEYARNDEKVELPKREVIIKEIRLLTYENKLIKFQVRVSKGTYIRSLIADICESLGTYGCMESLVRTRQGIFSINNSATIDDIKNNNYTLLKIPDFMEVETIKISKDNEKQIVNGNKIIAHHQDYVLYINDHNEEVALYNFIDNVGKPIIIF